MTRRGRATTAAARTIRSLVAAGALDRGVDAAAIDRLTALAGVIDAAAERHTVVCPGCECPVDVGPDTLAVVRVSRELRFWWQAIRARKESVSQGVTLDGIFAELDAAVRAADLPAGTTEPGPA